MVSNNDDVVVAPMRADELREEFRAAQRRFLQRRGVAFSRSTDFPHHEPLWAEPPPPAEIE